MNERERGEVGEIGRPDSYEIAPGDTIVYPRGDPADERDRSEGGAEMTVKEIFTPKYEEDRKHVWFEEPWSHVVRPLSKIVMNVNRGQATIEPKAGARVCRGCGTRMPVSLAMGVPEIHSEDSPAYCPECAGTLLDAEEENPNPTKPPSPGAVAEAYAEYIGHKNGLEAEAKPDGSVEVSFSDPHYHVYIRSAFRKGWLVARVNFEDKAVRLECYDRSPYDQGEY
jgi:hypothetical protein